MGASALVGPIAVTSVVADRRIKDFTARHVGHHVDVTDSGQLITLQVHEEGEAGPARRPAIFRQTWCSAAPAIIMCR
jgi:hypothetical protein